MRGFHSITLADKAIVSYLNDYKADIEHVGIRAHGGGLESR